MRTLAQRTVLSVLTLVLSATFLYTGEHLTPVTNSRTIRIRHQRTRFAHARERTRIHSPWKTPAPTHTSASAVTTDVTVEHKSSAEDRNDLVTKILRMVETQHVMGENCTAGTDLILADGVIASPRFRLEADVAVNRANFLTRLWRYAPDALRNAEYILYAGVRSMIDFDDDIFAAGNCYDLGAFNEELFCPFAYRLANGSVVAKDLSEEYKYLSNTSEWFYRARTSAYRVIANIPVALQKGFNLLRNHGSIKLPAEEEVLLVSYEDGWWTKPYFDCGGGNIWMMTYTVPFFGFANGSYVFKGTSGIDIDLRRVDIDQCPPGESSQGVNVFASSDKCKTRTTRCVSIPGLGFRRGSYKCECKDGFYYPGKENGFFSGVELEEEYEKLLQREDNLYDGLGMFECFPCADGCDTCSDDRPCVASINWVMRSAILALNGLVIGALPAVAIFTCKYREVKVVKAASPLLLQMIIVGAAFLYSTIVVMYFPPTAITCTIRIWLREIGFALSYGALLLKTWRSAKAIKITDMDLIKGLSFLVGTCTIFLAIRTLVETPSVITARTANDLKAFLCSTDWWDHSFTVAELFFLVWGIHLCIVVRKAPSEFNESKFISLAIYNEFLLSTFLNVSMLFLQSPANPDLLYIIFFCHSQLTTTLLLCLIFGSKAYLVLKGRGKEEEGSSSTFITKPLTAKFLVRPPKSTNSTRMAISTSPSVGQAPLETAAIILTEADAQEELDAIYIQLESLKEKNQRLGHAQIVAKITTMQLGFSVELDENVEIQSLRISAEPRSSDSFADEAHFNRHSSM
uniref:G-protein coupled receptors family 3 profile domain-containing protein n=1 Tax=Strigamia maritima TaxID=126957 RepID=T1JDG3_STRMM